jgi:hypothetical protein
MDYLSIFLAGVVLGIFVCMTLYALIVAFRPTPPTMYGRRRAVEPPPNMAQMPVHEAGIVAYQFLGVTGEEQP